MNSRLELCKALEKAVRISLRNASWMVFGMIYSTKWREEKAQHTDQCIFINIHLKGHIHSLNRTQINTNINIDTELYTLEYEKIPRSNYNNTLDFRNKIMFYVGSES